MANVITSAPDAIVHGTSGSDMLYSTGGGETYYGGAGNDSFVISLKSLQAPATDGLTYHDTIKADAAILDFGGAGGWSATNNDFLALTGFSAGSTFTFAKYGVHGSGVDVTSQFYTIHDAATNHDFTIFIHSTDGKLLSKGTGDVNFY